MTNPFTRAVFGQMYCDPSIANHFSAPTFVDRMLAFEAAWTRALAKVSAITSADEKAALDAMASFDQHDFSAGSDIDGVPVPSMVKTLRFGLESGAAKAIHTGATSQDVIDTAMVLTLLQVQSDLEGRLQTVLSKLDGLLERFSDAPMMARTRMQAALPATASLRLHAWKQALKGHVKRAEVLRAEIGQVQIGGAIGRRDLPKGHGDDVAALVAAELGLALTPVWHTDRSAPVSFGHWLTLVAGSLGKIGQDVTLMAQQGVDEIALRGGGGSSAMPHKQNPVAAEAMVSLARYVAVQQGGLAQAMIHEQERSGTAWALEWLTLPAMAEATGAALNHAVQLLDQIERIGSA